MKRGLLLLPMGSKKWMGGVYYMRNIAFQLSQNDRILSDYNIYLIVRKEMKSEFSDIPDSIKIIFQPEFNNNYILKGWKLYICIKNNIKFIFPFNYRIKFLGIQGIAWIPDFQDKYFPEMFDALELEKRDIRNRNILNRSIPLVLSSEDALNDCKQNYNINGKKVNVMPFVSYIEPVLQKIDSLMEKSILDKFGLSDKKYTCIMNQFWRHKNHEIIFKAIKIIDDLIENDDFIFVFTGMIDDRRNPQYIKELNKLMEDKKVKPHIKILGFIDREEQIVIMKNAEYIIQPSLFEGWGTVVEDAKVLDKTILLSDISVHREQMNDKCILFDPYNSEQLAALIVEENRKEHHDSIKKGLVDMRVRAREYTKEFQKILGCR